MMEDATLATVFLATTVGLCLAIVLFVIRYVIRRLFLALQAERDQRREAKRMARENFENLTRLGWNMVLVSYSDFVQGGKLLRYELARELGLHTTLDTYEDANRFCRENEVVFLSHQWLGEALPDPKNVHFEAACEMLEKLINVCNLNRDNIYIWVDYTSIPQSNKMMQQSAIGSIQVYATLPKYFVCVAPDAKHELGHDCNAKTYLNRGWCRLEQWARVSVGGLEGMFSFTTSNGLMQVTRTRGNMTHTRTGDGKDVSEDWLEKSIQVCKGDFTLPEDVHRIKGVVSALWMYAVLTKDRDPKLFDAVESDKKTVFPPEFFPNNYIAIAEGVAAELKEENWEKPFDAMSDRPVIPRAASRSSSFNGSLQSTPMEESSGQSDARVKQARDVEDDNAQATEDARAIDGEAVFAI
jgi:hypothetical protein